VLLCRVLVRLPDRPGSLGRVTTLLGRLGVDIRQVVVLHRDGNTATDAFTVTVPGSVIYRCLPELLEDLPGVQVLSLEPCFADADRPAAGQADAHEQAFLEPAQADDGLVEYLVALAEREADQVPAATRGGIGVEDLRRDRHDAAPLG
jgi:ACT domain